MLIRRDRYPAMYDLVAVGVLLLVVLVVLRDALLMRGTFYTIDVACQNFPIQHHFSSAVRGGKLPLWTSQLFCGFPLYAEGQGALFYPLNLLFYIRPTSVGLNLYIILHTFLAGLFLYWFARTTGISPAGALLAAMAYSLGSLITRYHGYLNHLGTLTWLPVPLALFNLWVRRRKFLWVVLGGLVLGVQWLAGHPQYAWFTHLALGLLLVFHLVRKELASRRDKLAAVGVVAFMVVVGLGLAAVQLLPMSELATFSERDTDVGYSHVLDQGLHPEVYAELLLPGLGYSHVLNQGLYPEDYVELLSPGYLGQIAQATALDFLEERAILYVGIVPLLLAPFALWRAPRAWKVALSVLLALGIILSLRDARIPARIIAWLPPANMFRFRVRYAILFVIALVLLAGRGLDAMLFKRPESRSGSKVPLPYLWIIGIAIAGAACAWYVYHVREDFLPGIDQHSLPALAKSKLQAIRDVRSADLVHLIVFWSGAAVTCALYLARKLGRRTFAALVLGQLAVNLLFFGVEGPSLIEPSFYTDRPKTLDVMAQEKAPFRVFGIWQCPANPFRGDGFFTLSADSRDNYQYYADLLATDMSLLYGVDNAWAFWHSLLLRRQMMLARCIHIREHADPKLLGLMNVKYVLSVNPLEKPGLELIFDERVKVYRNRFWLPRAFLVRAVAAADDEWDALAMLTFLEPRELAVVEGWDSPVRLDAQDGAAVGTATIVEYEDTHVAVLVDTPRDALLVLTDTNYPGWQAAVDGEPARIYQTNYLFRGVAVRAGKHRVTFDYRPASFRRGAMLSVGTLSIVGILLLGCAWRARRKRGSEPGRASRPTAVV